MHRSGGLPFKRRRAISGLFLLTFLLAGYGILFFSVFPKSGSTIKSPKSSTSIISSPVLKNKEEEEGESRKSKNIENVSNNSSQDNRSRGDDDSSKNKKQKEMEVVEEEEEVVTKKSSAAIPQLAVPSPTAEVLDLPTIEPLHCVAWRQTRGCTPDGEWERHLDSPCSSYVLGGRSGYCECLRGDDPSKRENLVRRAAHGCRHRAFRCEEICSGQPDPNEDRLLGGLDENVLRGQKGVGSVEKRTGVLKKKNSAAAGFIVDSAASKCTGFRQTMNCDPNGKRDPRNDKSCTDVILSGWSGFCECGDPSVTYGVECHHEPFTCRAACVGMVKEYQSALQQEEEDAEHQKRIQERLRALDQAHLHHHLKEKKGEQAIEDGRTPSSEGNKEGSRSNSKKNKKGHNNKVRDWWLRDSAGAQRDRDESELREEGKSRDAQGEIQDRLYGVDNDLKAIRREAGLQERVERIKQREVVNKKSKEEKGGNNGDAADEGELLQYENSKKGKDGMEESKKAEQQRRENHFGERRGMEQPEGESEGDGRKGRMMGGDEGDEEGDEEGPSVPQKGGRMKDAAFLALQQEYNLQKKLRVKQKEGAHEGDPNEGGEDAEGDVHGLEGKRLAEDDIVRRQRELAAKTTGRGENKKKVRSATTRKGEDDDFQRRRNEKAAIGNHKEEEIEEGKKLESDEKGDDVMINKQQRPPRGDIAGEEVENVGDDSFQNSNRVDLVRLRRFQSSSNKQPDDADRGQEPSSIHRRKYNEEQEQEPLVPELGADDVGDHPDNDGHPPDFIDRPDEFQDKSSSTEHQRLSSEEKEKKKTNKKKKKKSTVSSSSFENRPDVLAKLADQQQGVRHRKVHPEIAEDGLGMKDSVFEQIPESEGGNRKKNKLERGLGRPGEGRVKVQLDLPDLEEEKRNLEALDDAV